MAKNVDHELRKRAVLGAAINKYIKEAAPVASEDLALEFGLSSATIRNIFKELEQDGFLKHPYTSGGRIPTNKAYRYYVDFLAKQMELMDEEKARIGRELIFVTRGLGEILEKTTDLLSTLTRYASMVSFEDDNSRFVYKGLSLVLEQPEFQDYKRVKILLRMVEDKQRLLEIINRDFNEKVKVYIGDELECPEMDDCSLAVSTYSIRKKRSGKIAVLGPMRMEYKHIIPALEYVSDALSGILE